MQCGDILYKFMIVRTILCDKRDDLTNFKGFACTVSSGYRGKEILRLAYYRVLDVAAAQEFIVHSRLTPLCLVFQRTGRKIFFVTIFAL